MRPTDRREHSDLVDRIGALRARHAPRVDLWFGFYDGVGVGVSQGRGIGLGLFGYYAPRVDVCAEATKGVSARPRRLIVRR